MFIHTHTHTQTSFFYYWWTQFFTCLGHHKNTARNMWVHISFWNTGFAFFWCTYVNGIAGSLGISVCRFLRTLQSVFQCVSQLTCLQVVCKSSFSPTSCQHLLSVLFDASHSHRCEVISHCGFDLELSADLWCGASFHLFVGHLNIFLCKMSIQDSCPF